MIAQAQPTPARTSIASNGQLRWQAPHSMHRSRSVIRAYPSVHREHGVGADVDAQAAAFALFRVVFQRDDVFQVAQRHRILLSDLGRNAPAIIAPTPRTAPTTIRGTAALISRTTPESEVIVLDPVKFMARKADNAGKSENIGQGRTQPRRIPPERLGMADRNGPDRPRQPAFEGERPAGDPGEKGGDEDRPGDDAPRIAGMSKARKPHSEEPEIQRPRSGEKILLVKTPTISTGVRTIRSRNGSGPFASPGVAFIPASRKAGMSSARTGP